MGKKKTKGIPSPGDRRFKDLLQRLVAVSRKELDENMAEPKKRKR